MPTPDEFRARLRDSGVDVALNDFVLCDEAPHVTAEGLNYVRNMLCETYDEDPDSLAVYIVGSAKLGFSVASKSRYRLFGPDSDIDVAVASRAIFEKIWDELADYSNRSVPFPWSSGKLGDYLVYGWLRPDKFPKDVRLRQCDDWWECFRKITASGRLGRRKVSGALFYSLMDLKRYQRRALVACLDAEGAIDENVVIE